MATVRLNTIIKSTRTTSKRLIRLFNDSYTCSIMTPEQVVLVVAHPNATTELLDVITDTDFRRYPSVINQLTKRGDLLNETLISFIADILVANYYSWDEDDWYLVMQSFKELITEYELSNFEDLLTFTFAECINDHMYSNDSCFDEEFFEAYDFDEDDDNRNDAIASF